MSWTLIESQTLGSAVASVTLGSGGTLPQTYKTLRLVTSIRMDNAGAAANAQVTFNGSSSGYSERLLYGNGVSASSANASGSSIGWTNLATSANGTSSTFGNSELTIANYASTSQYKAITSDAVNESNWAAANYANQYLDAALWSSSAAITSITLNGNGANFVAGSTFTLYGLK